MTEATQRTSDNGVSIWLDDLSRTRIESGSLHPEVALRNARARFSLTWREEDIIRSHMFPYTPTKVYRCLESAVVAPLRISWPYMV